MCVSERIKMLYFPLLLGSYFWLIQCFTFLFKASAASFAISRWYHSWSKRTQAAIPGEKKRRCHSCWCVLCVTRTAQTADVVWVLLVLLTLLMNVSCSCCMMNINGLEMKGMNALIPPWVAGSIAVEGTTCAPPRLAAEGAREGLWQPLPLSGWGSLTVYLVVLLLFCGR